MTTILFATTNKKSDYYVDRARIVLNGAQPTSKIGLLGLKSITRHYRGQSGLTIYRFLNARIQSEAATYFADTKYIKYDADSYVSKVYALIEAYKDRVRLEATRNRILSNRRFNIDEILQHPSVSNSPILWLSKPVEHRCRSVILLRTTDRTRIINSLPRSGKLVVSTPMRDWARISASSAELADSVFSMIHDLFDSKDIRTSDFLSPNSSI